MERDTVLVVDDEELNRDLLNLIFEKDYKVATCCNGKEALEYLTKKHRSVAIILLDLYMPVIDGMALLKLLKMKGITKYIPVIIITAEQSPEKAIECYDKGAVDFIPKPFVAVVVKGRVKNIIELYRSKHELEIIVNQQTKEIQEKNTELHGYNDRILEVMSSIVEFRNLESGNHIKKIKGMTRIMAETCNKLYPDVYHLTPETIEIMESSSALHDIGKIAISDTILLKPGRLTADEFEVIKSHTTLGCEIIKVIEELQSKNYLEISYNICRHHHERYDGKGYPDNLEGEDIPIEAQLVSIVDAYESLIGDRVYRDAYDKDKAFDMIMTGECGVFSERMLNCFSKARPIIDAFCSKFDD